MEALEIKVALEAIKGQVDSKSSAQALEVKGLIEALEAKMTSEKDLAVNELKSDMAALQAHADKLDVKLKEKAKSEDKSDSLVKSITENFNDIKEVRNGKSIQVKAVGDMTLPVNLTGAQPKDYNFDVVLNPSQMLNVSDIVGAVSISGGTYTFVRENGAGEGAIGAQVEGATKGQKDYDISMIDVNTDFIAGFTRYSKKMANNLPFLTSFIPNALRRDYAKAENAAFNAVLAANATASTEIITNKNKVEMLINEIAKQENLDFPVTAIVLRPTDYYDILVTQKSVGAGYGLPGVVTQDNGVLRINGIPLFRATWLAANKYYVGDWTRVTKVTTEGLSLEFSEVEGTNFVKNNITARIEAQVALAVEQPAALIFGDFTAV
ncbi:major capsid protein precursor [Flavobacterium phage 11b]|uniref:major capsid protein precursor n=1 Tax=Flavobacterium phage 11b TaxID=294631 RepID=UPI0000444133|nr:major capsid protein precursor [Flavobacterium phage 11b]CAH56648.1 major capsid protein precursor [Flavobacterium phage 11b]